jgi:hypothetical protein
MNRLRVEPFQRISSRNRTDWPNIQVSDPLVLSERDQPSAGRSALTRMRGRSADADGTVCDLGALRGWAARSRRPVVWAIVFGATTLAPISDDS